MATAINSLQFGGGTYVFTTPYAICNTPLSQKNKVATTTPSSNFSLETGARVLVKFSAHGGASPTLNINNTGAKPIYYRGSAVATNQIRAKGTYEFIYNGSQWDLIGDVDTNTNTLNTAGSSLKTGTKLYIVGANYQTSSTTTYSNDSCYIGTDNCLYSGRTKVATTEDIEWGIF